MTYINYLLDNDSSVIKTIENFLVRDKEEQDKIKQEEDKYGALGFIQYQRSLWGLKFEEGKQPDGWREPAILNPQCEVEEDATYRYYKLMGSSKEAKAQRQLWSSLAMLTFRHFTNMIDNLPKGTKGWGFQKGLTIRFIGFTETKKGYVLSVPIKDGEDQYRPDKAKELLPSEALKLGIKN